MSNKKNDSEYAVKIAQYLDIKYKTINFDTEEFDQIYEDFFSKISEPQSNAALLPTYFLAKKIEEESVRVVLTGTGIDEYFLGYERDKKIYRLRENCDYKINILDKLYVFLPDIKLKRTIFSTLFYFFKKPISLYLLNTSLKPNINSWIRFKNECRTKKLNPINLEPEFYLENDLLKYSDSALSFASIEGRVPFVSTNIIDESKKNQEYLIHNNESKYLIKKILEDYIPKELIYRQKSGFGLPLIKYYKESKFFKKDLLSSISFLNETKLSPIIKKLNINLKKIEKNNPYLLFTIVTLYHSLR